MERDEEERLILRHSELVALVQQAVEEALAAREADPGLEDRKIAEVDDLARIQEAHNAQVLAEMGKVTIYPEESIILWWNGHRCDLVGHQDNLVPAVFEGVYRDHVLQQEQADVLRDKMAAEYREKQRNSSLVQTWRG